MGGHLAISGHLVGWQPLKVVILGLGVWREAGNGEVKDPTSTTHIRGSKRGLPNWGSYHPATDLIQYVPISCHSRAYQNMKRKVERERREENKEKRERGGRKREGEGGRGRGEVIGEGGQAMRRRSKPSGSSDLHSRGSLPAVPPGNKCYQREPFEKRLWWKILRFHSHSPGLWDLGEEKMAWRGKEWGG